jgi:hypothetical protein
MRAAVLALACLALSGCESTQEKSARLEKAALANQHGPGARAKQLTITRPSAVIKVVSSSLVHSSEGMAAVVVLRNGSATAQSDVPIAITAHGAGGGAVYTNTSGGQAASLVSAALVPAHGELTWVDDQVQASSTPTAVTAEVGEGKPVKGAAPKVAVSSYHLGEEPGGLPVLQGTLANRSSLAQSELAIYAVASAGGRVQAAGRAVLPSLATGASASFQIFLIGTVPHGAHITLDAPPTVLR